MNAMHQNFQFTLMVALFVVAVILGGCGGTQAAGSEAWKVANLLTRGQHTSTTEPVYQDVENCCGDGNRISISCSAGTSNDISIALGGSIGLALGGQLTVDPQVAAQLGFNQSSGQSVELTLPPPGYVYTYKVTKKFMVWAGKATLTSTSGSSEEADYTYNASCAVLTERIGGAVACNVSCNSNPVIDGENEQQIASSASSPASPTPTEDLIVPTVTHTPTEVPSSQPTEPPTLTPTATAQPTNTPIPTAPVVINTEIPRRVSALQDVRLRRAIAYCTDKGSLVRSVYPGLADLAVEDLLMDSILPKSHWAYAQPTAQYPYAPAQGKALLEQIGWVLPDGSVYRTNELGEELSLTLTTTDSEFRKAWVSVFEGQMRLCGIHIIPKHVSAEWWFGDDSGLARREFEMGAFAWYTPTDDDLSFSDFVYGCGGIPSRSNNWQGQNYMGWCNEFASEAAEQASRTQLSRSERKHFMAALQEEIANDVPSLPLFLRDDLETWEHIDFNLSP